LDLLSSAADACLVDVRDRRQLGGVSAVLEPITLHVFCEECVGAVTIQMSEWPSVFNRDGSPAEDDYPAPTIAEWFCPYCQVTNASEFPGRMAWATEGHEPARTV
jgi:hypothetical protein